MKGLSYKAKLFINLAIVYLVWGSTFLGVKIGLKDLSPMLLGAVRFALGGFALFIITFFFYEKPTLKKLIGSSKLGILLIGAGTSGVAYSLLFLPTGISALLVAILPLWIMVFDYFFFSKIKPSNLSILGMLLGVLGVLLLFNPFGLEKSNSLPITPILIVCLGTICWAYGSLIGSKTPQLPGLQGVSIQMLSGGLFSFCLSLLLETNQLNSFLNMSNSTIYAMFFLILIGSYLGYQSFSWLVNNAPPVVTSSYAFINPVVALILGYYFAEESLDTISLLACIIILVAVILMVLGRRKKKSFHIKELKRV